MKRLPTVGMMIAVLVFTSAVLFGAEPDQAQLARTAKITKKEAEHIALAKVPKGSIKSGEIEREKGRLIWSFDIAKPGSVNITEVQVDAMTGKIVTLQVETPKDQVKEAAGER